MIVRALNKDDINQLESIHAQHFSTEFDIDNFNHLIEQAFVVEKHGDIICAGGIKSLAEAVLITDLSKNEFDRVKALKEALKIFKFIAHRTGHDSIHAFIQDDKWCGHLKNEGFEDCKGNAIFLRI